MKASDGSNGDEGSPSLDEPSSSSLLPGGDASRAAVAPSARFDMMMNGQLLRSRGSLQPSRSRVCKSAVTDASARLLGAALTRKTSLRGGRPHKKKVDLAVDTQLNLVCETAEASGPRRTVSSRLEPEQLGNRRPQRRAARGWVVSSPPISWRGLPRQPGKPPLTLPWGRGRLLKPLM